MENNQQSVKIYNKISNLIIGFLLAFGVFILTNYVNAI